MYPWDRRGEVYIRYGEPDYRSTSNSLNADMPPKAQRIKERMAVDLYGTDAVGEFFTGPVFPVRSNRAFSTKAPNPQDMGLTSDEIRLIFLLEDAQDAERTELSERVQASDGGEGDQANRILDQEQTLAALGDVNTGNLSFSPSRVRKERFVETGDELVYASDQPRRRQHCALGILGIYHGRRGTGGHIYRRSTFRVISILPRSPRMCPMN